MKPLHYRDMIIRAVLGPESLGAVVADSATLDLIASALAQAEAAKAILCAKHYGVSEQSIDDVARSVPHAREL